MNTNAYKLIGLTIAFSAAVYISLVRPALEGAASPTGNRVLRVAHTLTDDGVRKAFEEAAARYQRLHPERKVIIQTVPSRIYSQWANTQVIGETAPDILQVTNNTGQWSEFAQRHLLPLGSLISQPNPYNHDAPSATAPWFSTFKDNLESGFFLHLMEYYRVPVALNTTRIIINKQLFEEIMGHTRFPTDLVEYHEFAERTKAHPRSTATAVYPMAVSADYLTRSGENSFVARQFLHPATMNVLEAYDIAFWNVQETPHYGLINGSLTLADPIHVAAFSMFRDFAQTCQPGYTVYNSDDVRMLFLQRRAVAMVGNTWDFGVLERLADFEISVIPFPRLAREHDGVRQHLPRARDTVSDGMSLGVFRRSPNIDWAVDFLHFIASERENHRVCESLDWIPSVSGAPPTARLAPFEPSTQGPIGSLLLSRGPGQTNIYTERQLPLLLTGRITPEDFLIGLEQVWLRHGEADVATFDTRLMRGTKVIDRNIARFRAEDMFLEARINRPRGFGSRTASGYVLGNEMLDLLVSHVTERRYLLQAVTEGTYPYPPAVNPPPLSEVGWKPSATARSHLFFPSDHE